METALMQHSAQTSGAQTSQRPNGGAQMSRTVRKKTVKIVFNITLSNFHQL